MPSDFDPHLQWLEIPIEQRPPNHYQLLGLEPLTDDFEGIDDAFQKRYALVRRYQIGEHSAVAVEILKELSRAHDCLTNEATKQQYDLLLTPQKESSKAAVGVPERFRQSHAAIKSDDRDVLAEEFVAEETISQATSDWFYQQQGQTFGPFSHNQMLEATASGLVQFDTLVWKTGWEYSHTAVHVFAEAFPGYHPQQKDKSAPRPVLSSRATTLIRVFAIVIGLIAAVGAISIAAINGSLEAQSVKMGLLTALAGVVGMVVALVIPALTQDLVKSWSNSLQLASNIIGNCLFAALGLVTLLGILLVVTHKERESVARSDPSDVRGTRDPIVSPFNSPSEIKKRNETPTTEPPNPPKPASESVSPTTALLRDLRSDNSVTVYQALGRLNEFAADSQGSHITTAVLDLIERRNEFTPEILEPRAAAWFDDQRFSNLVWKVNDGEVPVESVLWIVNQRVEQDGLDLALKLLECRNIEAVNAAFQLFACYSDKIEDVCLRNYSKDFPRRSLDPLLYCISMFGTDRSVQLLKRIGSDFRNKDQLATAIAEKISLRTSINFETRDIRELLERDQSPLSVVELDRLDSVRFARSLTFSQDGNLLIASPLSGDTAAYDIYDKKQRWSADFGTGTNFAFSTDGKRLFVATRREISCLDASDGSVIWEAMSGTRFESLATHPSDDYVVAAGSGGQIHLLDPDTGSELSSSKVSKYRVEWMEFSPDGQLLVTYDRVGDKVRIWNRSGDMHGEFDTKSGFDAVKIAPDGSRISVSRRNICEEVTLWNISNGELENPVRGLSRADDFQFSNDGKTGFIYDAQRLAGIDLQTREVISQTYVGSSAPYNIRVIPGSNRYLAFNSSEGIIVDSKTGQIEARVDQMRGPVAVSPNGKLIAYGARTGGIVIAELQETTQ